MPTYQYKEYLRIMRPLPAFVKRRDYKIPVIEADYIDISEMNNGLWLVNMKNVSPKDKNARHKIVHAFCYDDVLERAYNNPVKFLSRVASYYAVSSFDFSMDADMDFSQIMAAVYKNRWIGAFMQANGKKVIPTVGWLKADTYEICFSGLQDGSVFIISTRGVNNTICYPDFIEGYKEMRRRFPWTKIICVGERVEDMDDDVCYIRYKESFGSWDRYQNWWQPQIYNWDMTVRKERE